MCIYWAFIVIVKLGLLYQYMLLDEFTEFFC